MNMLIRIIDGDPRRGDGKGDHPSRNPSLLVDESGMISLVTVFTWTFLLVVAALVVNVALNVGRKIEVQNGADSISYSSALAMARGTNAITAANHVIGELQALVVLHHAFGGNELDNGESPPMSADESGIVTELDFAFIAAELVAGAPSGPSSTVYNDTRERPQAGATLHDSVVRLQQVLAWAYEAYAVGGAMEKAGQLAAAEFPVAGAILYGAGFAVIVAALAFETKVRQERFLLGVLEKIARALVPVKKILEMLIVGIHHGYCHFGVVFEGPQRVADIVREIAQSNAVDGALYPNPEYRKFQFPVETEPGRLPAMHKSQLVRASYPWINHWRVPILKFMRDWLLLARSAYFYKHYSNLFTLDKAREMKEKRSVNLYIVKDLDLAGSDKGYEPWTHRSDRADQRFCVIGFAHRQAPAVMGTGFFQQQNPDGIVAYAQAITYNANPQYGPGDGTLQARVGWDTLNWVSPVLEYKMQPGNTSDEPSDQPQIRVNWQAKLVPVTRLLKKSLSSLADPFRAVMTRAIPEEPSLKTH